MNESPTLESAIQAFDQWRSQRQKRTNIPTQLREMAVALRSKHSLKVICSKLRINSSALKSWAAKDEQAFLNLPLAQVSTSLKPKVSLSLHAAKGDCYQLEGELDAPFIARLILDLQRGADQ